MILRFPLGVTYYFGQLLTMLRLAHIRVSNKSEEAEVMGGIEMLTLNRNVETFKNENSRHVHI